MVPEPSQAAELPVLADAVCEAIARRYPESGASRYGISTADFLRIVSAVVIRYAAEAGAAEQMQLVGMLHVAELSLARACSAGNDAAWEEFLTRFRAPLYETAYRVAKDETAARELADELYADLYGIPGADGRRVSKLDYYMGRGSLEGWLRTVLSQRFIDRCRSQARLVSLEEQTEAGIGFAAPSPPDDAAPDPRLAAALDAALDELHPEERFLIAAWYLDQRTLADIGRQLGAHESTISRRLDRLTGGLRKAVRKRLQAEGISSRRCDEMLHDLDVRDLNANVTAKLRQESLLATFYKKDRSTT